MASSAPTTDRPLSRVTRLLKRLVGLPVDEVDDATSPAEPAPALIALDDLGGGECPLQLLRGISPAEHVTDFLSACKLEIESALATIERLVATDGPAAELRAQLHRMRNAFSNACLSSHVAALPHSCNVATSSAHYAEHMPVLRALVTQALQYLQSQPEYRINP